MKNTKPQVKNLGFLLDINMNNNLIQETKLAIKFLEKIFEKINGRKPDGKDIAYYAPYTEIYTCKRNKPNEPDNSIQK